MLHYGITFDRPAFLLLLAVVPLFWRLGQRSLGALGSGRRALALVLRTVVATAIILALADIQFRRESGRLTVVYLLDQSLSVPVESRQAMLRYVQESIDQGDQRQPGDRFAVIAFGRDAAIEIPPVDADVPAPARLESLVDPEYTDVAAAVERAQSLFPHDAARRIVLVTDGNENAGNVYREARAAADAGVSIDVAPVFLTPRSDVAVEKIDAPGAARSGQPFDIRVVLRNDGADAADDGPTVAGSLRIVRKAGEREEIVADQHVELGPGKKVFRIPETIDRADFYTYEARFVADDPTAEATPQNNAASAFVGVRGRGAVLVIESAEQRGDFDFLVDRLRAEEIEVTLTSADNLFNSLAELQRYDSVVLAGVARTSADETGDGASFSDDQISMLVRNTREMGCGLVMLGGPEALGAGGWANTDLEAAMPVDFQVKAAEVVPVGALAIVLDRSGSMAGEKLHMSKAAAIAAMRTMGRRDFINVVTFDSAPYETVPLRRVGDFSSAARRVDVLGAGGGTDMFPAMRQAYNSLRRAEAGVKHMIVLTDGQTPDADFAGLVRQMRSQNITVTAVAVGADANVSLLQRIATQGGGKFYGVRSPRNLPRIFLREVRRVARPLVFEPSSPVVPQVVTDHEILNGVVGVPPISGLVLTTVKENPLVEVVLRSPLPATEKNATVLATWNYGAGRAAVFTTDAGRRWTKFWPAWDGYDKFFIQLVRWSMRPTDGGGNFSVAADVRDGRAQLAITALDANDEFLNDRSMTAVAVAPDMTSETVAIEQTAPGRYVGSFPTKQAGSYLVVVNPAPGLTPIRTGISVGYFAEYDDRQTNLALLESIARLEPRGGPPGVFLRQGLDAPREDTPSAFRHDLPRVTSSQSIWPWIVVVGCCLFWGDVFVRRVQVNLAWLAPAIAAVVDRVLRRPRLAPAQITIERLRTRKQEIGQQIDSRASRSRFVAESPPEAAPSTVAVPPAPPANMPDPPPSAPVSDAANDPAGPESFSERLLRAKQQVWRDRDDPK